MKHNVPAGTVVKDTHALSNPDYSPLYTKLENGKWHFKGENSVEYTIKPHEIGEGKRYQIVAPTPTNTIQEQKLHTQGEWATTKILRPYVSQNEGYPIFIAKTGVCVAMAESAYSIPLAEAKANAELIVKAVNEYPKLIEVVKELLEICKGVKFMFGNEANYPEGTNGYRIAKDIEIALNKSKEILP